MRHSLLRMRYADDEQRCLLHVRLMPTRPREDEIQRMTYGLE